MIKLGQKAKDKVTGFEGTIVARSQHLYGCDQYCIMPKAKKGKQAEMKHQNGMWFDEGRLEITGKGILPAEVRVKKNGADTSINPELT